MFFDEPKMESAEIRRAENAFHSPPLPGLGMQTHKLSPGDRAFFLALWAIEPQRASFFIASHRPLDLGAQRARKSVKNRLRQIDRVGRLAQQRAPAKACAFGGGDHGGDKRRPCIAKDEFICPRHRLNDRADRFKPRLGGRRFREKEVIIFKIDAVEGFASGFIQSGFMRAE